MGLSHEGLSYSRLIPDTATEGLQIFEGSTLGVEGDLKYFVDFPELCANNTGKLPLSAVAEYLMFL